MDDEVGSAESMSDTVSVESLVDSEVGEVESSSGDRARGCRS